MSRTSAPAERMGMEWLVAAWDEQELVLLISTYFTR
jgi:hypothetical protein